MNTACPQFRSLGRRDFFRIGGATDEHAAFVTYKYYKVESFGRTLYHLLGIDADQVLHTTENRPHKLIVDDAPLIKEALD